ncbi:type II toxin-antitoxin system HicA family toxin [candidate division KSB1 bacterium]|nr:type II toxin-antitoxin system HicA family toxin [candidate division KSB1 bacterium]
MAKLRELSTREVQKRLKKLGFRFYRQGKGSHEIWTRDEDGKIIPVPSYKGKNIRKGTIAAIIRELELSVEEFMKL